MPRFEREPSEYMEKLVVTSKAEMRSFVSALGRDVTPQDLAP